MKKCVLCFFMSIFLSANGLRASSYWGLEIENKTRIGYEIEASFHYRLDPQYAAHLAQNWGRTLAETAQLEFIFDDSPQNPAVEFRSKPEIPVRLTSSLYWHSVWASLRHFPYLKLGAGSKEERLAALSAAGWQVTPLFAKFIENLTLIEYSRPTQARTKIQHVTHSLPLKGFLSLSFAWQKILFPELSSPLDNLRDLITLMISKIPGTSGGEAWITTVGRNKSSPNFKTPVNILLRYRDPLNSEHQKISLWATQLFPRCIFRSDGPKIVSGLVAREIPCLSEMPNPSLAPLPSRNPDIFGEGHVSSEEKPRAPLYDGLRHDLRVLVEHRSPDLLWSAVSNASLGNPQPLLKLAALWRQLDRLPSPEEMLDSCLLPSRLKSDRYIKKYASY